MKLIILIGLIVLVTGCAHWHAPEGWTDAQIKQQWASCRLQASQVSVHRQGFDSMATYSVAFDDCVEANGFTKN